MTPQYVKIQFKKKREKSINATENLNLKYSITFSAVNSKLINFIKFHSRDFINNNIKKNLSFIAALSVQRKIHSECLFEVATIQGEFSHSAKSEYVVTETLLISRDKYWKIYRKREAK